MTTKVMYWLYIALCLVLESDYNFFNVINSIKLNKIVIQNKITLGPVLLVTLYYNFVLKFS